MFNIFNKLRKPKIQDKDEAVLNQLAKYNSNLSKPHSIDFFLYFPTQEIVEQGRTMVQERFSDASVIIINADQGFLLRVTREIIPSLDTLQNASAQFDAITATLGGKYDGWETGIVK